jgi:pimeloyl-ACP methyl ester carboxylesterase
VKRIIIEEKELSKIPVVEYFPDQATFKGLYFIQHGFESNKTRGADFLAINIARLGYKVVSIDAYKHGNRKEEPYISMSGYYRLKEAFNVIDKTANDILDLFKQHYSAFDQFNIIGVSLGGMVAYLLATRTDKINRLIPVVSTPDFLKQAYYAIGDANIDTKKFFTKDKLQYIDFLDPLPRYKSWKYNELAIFINDNDHMVPPRSTLKFIKNHPDMVTTYQVFNDKHNVSRPMQEALLSYINGKKVTL